MPKYSVSRELLIRTATEVVEELGVEKASLREVARRAGISHGAPRSQYPTWNALLADVAKGMALQLDQQLEGCRLIEDDPRAVLLLMAETYIRFARQRPAAFALIHRHDLLAGQGAHLRQTTSGWIRMVRQQLQAGGGRYDDTAVIALWTAIHGYAVFAVNRAPDAVIHMPPEQAEVLGLAIDRALSDRD